MYYCKFINSYACNWNKWLEPLLFKAQEVLQAFTGFSQFELLYVCRHHSIFDVMSENWEEGCSESKSEIQYILDLFQNLRSHVNEEFAKDSRTPKPVCIISMSSYVNLHWEIRFSFYSPHHALNCLRSGKGPLKSHSELGMSTMRLSKQIEVSLDKFITLTSSHQGERSDRWHWQ